MPKKKLKKRRIALVIVVITMFLAAYAHHRYARKGSIVGRLQDKTMDEISGIAASAVNKDVFYVHNDSGDSCRFFAIDETGKLKTIYHFPGEANGRKKVRDCEDIAVGPGPGKGKSYIYLGDIGDNAANHRYISVFRFLEPMVTDNLPDANIKGSIMYYRYPDGPRDAETLMIDPLEKLLYIVSKRKDSVTVYTSPLNYHEGDTVTLTKQCRLHFKGLQPLKWITAGDISADGQQVLLKNYTTVYHWQRKPGEHIWETMQRLPAELEYEQEKQGEAIGFSRDGKSFYTTSEGVYSPIYRYFLPDN